MKPVSQIVFIGLSLSSSWGNGHATTYRSLLRGLEERGCRITFLERDVPWYAAHRDLADPDFCSLQFYSSVEQLVHSYGRLIRAADAVIIGSYVPEGVAVIDEVAGLGPRRLCFYDIDTPVTLARLDKGDEDYIAARQMGLFDLYFSFSGGQVLTTLETRHGVRKAVALHCSVDPERYHNTGQPMEWDLGYLGTYSVDRQPALERLLIEPARCLPGMKFVVAGPQFPPGLEWPDNVERIDHVAPHEHASFYSRQRFTLNLTRSDMVKAGWSPSVRLFEAAACRVPVISDSWRGLDGLLPENEAIVIAHDANDVISALTGLSQIRRDRIARKAADIVLTQHTGWARAGELVEALQAVGPVSPAGRFAVHTPKETYHDSRH